MPDTRCRLGPRRLRRSVSMQKEFVIERGGRVRLATALRELWTYRAIIIAFAERNVRVKYKQAALGIAWAVIQPLVFMAIFTLTIGRLAGVSGGGVDYAAFTLSALVPWTFLSTGVSFGANALITDGALIRKVYFPREVPVLGAILAAVVDFLIALILFFVVGPFLGAQVSAWWLLAPVLAIPLTLLAAGVSIVFGALNVYYRDFRYALPFLLQLWLFASPVAYPLSAVPESWRWLYLVMNPAAGLIDAFSRTLAAGVAPDVPALSIGVAETIVVSFVGYRVFKALEPSFADVI
jgi:lipopolysaccharide transport system permease protein